MNAIVIASIVVALTLLLGALLAAVVRGFSRAVDKEDAASRAERANYQPAMTFGYSISVDAELGDQLQEARKLAAREAAYLPRGANVGIGKSEGERQRTSFDGIESDPLSAVRMAHFHGWAGLKTGTQQAPEATAAAVKGVAEAVAPTKVSGDLIPGKDFAYIEITEEMNPAEKRKARIANAKAKSAAMKAAKAAATTTVTAESLPATPTSGAPPTPGTETLTGAGEPVPGVDYEVISITDDMPPDEIRKARIANAKAKSAAKKRFKEAGGVSAASAPLQADAGESSPESPQVEDDAASSPGVSVPSNIPAPNYIEITEGMDNDEIRKARIQNAKEKSAYNKALRAAGIDPKSVNP